MFLNRNLYARKKIVGGSLLGNVFSRVKNAALTQGRAALSTLPSVKALAKLGANKALEVAKKEVSPDKVKEIAFDLASENKKAAKKKATLLASKTKQRIAELTTSPEAKKALQDQAKKLLTDNSRAMLSNLLAGSGMKRIT